MISIRYPGQPEAVDASGLFNGISNFGENLKARKAWEQYDKWLRGGVDQQQTASVAPQSIAPQQQPLDYASQRVAQAHSASGGPPQGAIESYIRHAAQKRGIDPEIAVKVAMSEGGVTDPVRQSDVVKDGVREQSYGPFQLYMGGGLGNEFQQATGMHPSDPGAWQKGIDFALDKAKEGGWGPWYGAAKVGIGERDGIGAGAPQGAGAQGEIRQGSDGQNYQYAQTTGMAGQTGDQGWIRTSQGGNDLLPPPEVMRALFRSEQTRPLAIQLSESARKARMGDPEEALRLRKLRAEVQALENPQAKPTDDMREYEAARAQGFQGSLQDWIVGNRKAGATNVNVNTGEPGDVKLRESLDKAEGDQWAAYKQTATTSGSSQQDFAILDELINIAPQGPITGRLAEAFPGVSTAGDAFQSIVKRIAPTLRAPGSGSTSDIEYDGMLRSLPALRNNPDANRLINQIMKEKATINVHRGDIITQYQTGSISAADARRQLSELDKVSIITPDMKKLLGIAGGEGGAKNRTSSGVEWSLDD